MSHDFSPESISTVDALREALAPFGYGGILDGLSDDSDERDIMSRLVEMGADLSGPKGAEGKLHPTAKELAAFVAASKYFRDAAHRDVLLGRVRIHTYSEDPAEVIMAHRALSHVDPMSARIVLHHDRQALQKQRDGTQAQAMRIVT